MVLHCPSSTCNFKGKFRQLSRHLKDHHFFQRGNGLHAVSNVYPFSEVTAFQGFLRSYRHRLPEEDEIFTVLGYMEKYRKVIKRVVRKNVKRGNGIRMQFSFLVEFCRGDEGTPEYEEIERYENSTLKTCYSIYDFADLFNDVSFEILGYIELFEQYGSGWSLKSVRGLDIRLGRLPPIGGSCFVELPKHFCSKRCFINVRNEDQMCFKWAFLSIMHYKDVKKNRQRWNYYQKYEHLYDFSSVSYPASLRDVEKFNKYLEAKNICVNIFGLEKVKSDYQTVVRKMAKNSTNPLFKKVNLLLYDDSKQATSHYLGITDISRLFGKHNSSRKEFCYNCLNLVSMKQYKLHTSICTRFKTQNVKMPKKDNTKKFISFDQYEKLIPHEYVIYADLEALCIPTNFKKPDSQFSYTHKYQKHTPSGYAFAVFHNGKVEKYHVDRSATCIDGFFIELCNEVEKIEQEYNKYTPMLALTEDEEHEFEEACVCHICKQDLDTFFKVKDHDHKTGRYRGAAHQYCNSKFTLKKAKIPVLFHNFRKYDSHLLISGFERFGKNITVIPTNSENYMSIICDNFVFLDSLMFLNASLASLVENLKKPEPGKCEDIHFRNVFSPLIDVFGYEKALKLSRKGVYFYEYVTDFQQFSEKEFPSRDSFFNSLTGDSVSEADYQYANDIYKSYCKTLGDYHDVYLLTDCLLLGCVMENFRKTTISSFKLDPLHYFSLSGLAFNAALLKSGVKLEMIHDLDMYQFFETGLRGGTSMIVTREAIANNKYMENYNHQKPNSFLCYFDKTNLYGEALLSSLPVGEFQWLSETELDSVDESTILDWKDDDKYGYVCMVDLHYPSDLHQLHNDFPLMPEKLRVPYKSLSKYQKSIVDKLDLKYNDKFHKLIPHLGDRNKYVVHYRNLKYYLEKGIKLKKVHKVLKFRQEPWLRDYVLFNAEKRKNAKNAFEKDVYKFFVNAVFGKTIENVRKRRDIKIVNNLKTAKKLLSKPTLKNFQILGKNLAIFEMEHPHITLNKPVYTGFTCLDIAKLLVYEFHYDKFLKFYGERAKLLFTDTDSAAYAVNTKDLYKDLKKFHDIMDFSDYPTDHFLFSETNKKRIGSMKDEGAGKIFTHFIGLAPKLYSFKGNGVYKNAAKGIRKSVVKKSFRHDKFVDTFKQQQRSYAVMNVIRSYKHTLHTVEIRKSGLTCFDSKRYILPSGVNTLAYNHFLLKPLKRIV